MGEQNYINKLNSKVYTHTIDADYYNKALEKLKIDMIINNRNSKIDALLDSDETSELPESG